MKKVGADEVVDYKKPEAEQIDDIVSKTGGQLDYVLDATGQNLGTLGPLFKKITTGKKLSTSTNDWTPVETGGEFSFHAISLGPVGKPNERINDVIKGFLPHIYKLVQDGKLEPQEPVLVGEGVDALPEAHEFQKAGKGGSKKVLVKIADP